MKDREEKDGEGFPSQSPQVRGKTRREFLKLSAGTVVGLTVAGGLTAGGPLQVGARPLSEEALRGLAYGVLPSDVGEGDRERIVTGFKNWTEEYRAGMVRELGYGTSEIRVTVENPQRRWSEQLTRLEEIAMQRFGRSLLALERDEVQALVREETGTDILRGLPSPQVARHVAVAFLAYFYRRPETADFAYGASIGPNTCRPLHLAPERPRLATHVSWS